MKTQYFSNYPINSYSLQRKNQNSYFKPNDSTPKINLSAKDLVSFSSKTLYHININEVDYATGKIKLIPAKIVRLFPEDKNDLKVVENIDWWRSHKSQFSNMISYFFKDEVNDLKVSPPKTTNLDKTCYLAIEVHQDKATNNDNILSIASARIRPSRSVTQTEHDNDLYIEYLQSSPVSMKDSSIRKFKGAGELLMYGACRQAIDNGMDKLTLYSVNHSFYKYLGMPKYLGSVFPDENGYDHIFNLDEMKSFIKKIADKYKIG